MALGLGELFAPRRSQMQAPTPEQPVTDVTGAPVQAPAEGKVNGLMRHPAMQAFMLNTAANLLSSNGWGPSFAAGLEGAGRAMETKTAADKAREEEEYNSMMQQMRMAPRGGGGGKGGGKTGEASPTFKLDEKKYKAEYERLMETVDPGDPIAVAQANAAAMAYAGDPRAYQLLNSAPPEERATIAANMGTIYGAQSTVDAFEKYVPPTAPQGVPDVQPEGRTAPVYGKGVGGVTTPGVQTPEVQTPSVSRRPAPERKSPQGTSGTQQPAGKGASARRRKSGNN